MKKLAWMAAVALLCGLTASPASAQRWERNRIRAPEIQASNATSVYQLIQSRRGMWLMRNQSTDMSGQGGAAVLVFMDGAQLESVEDLRQVPIAGVQLIEFLTPGETEHRLGKYTTVGAIRVMSRDDTPQDSTHAAHPR
jgi:hypothetical protein